MNNKIKGGNPLGLIIDEVSGNHMLRAHQALGRLAGNVEKSAERLAVSYSADEIVRASTRTPGCTCTTLNTDVKVHPDVAYALARKSPARTSAEAAITAIAANYGGNIPLYTLGKVLGPWDSLIEELVPRRRG